jgi:hypothetical protein
MWTATTSFAKHTSMLLLSAAGGVALCRGEVMAYKAILAADTGSALSINTTTTKSALASGKYTFYWESSATIGTPSDPMAINPKTNAAWKFQECLDACDAEGDCLAAGMTKVTRAAATLTQTQAEAQAAAVIGSCRVVKGVMTPGVGKRSVVRVNLDRMSLPTPPSEYHCLCRSDFCETQSRVMYTNPSNCALGTDTAVTPQVAMPCNGCNAAAVVNILLSVSHMVQL